jgi:hypothetical protein
VLVSDRDGQAVSPVWIPRRSVGAAVLLAVYGWASMSVAAWSAIARTRVIIAS